MFFQRKYEQEQREKHKRLKEENESDSEDDEYYDIDGDRSYGVLDLFKTPNLCRKTLIITFIW